MAHKPKSYRAPKEGGLDVVIPDVRKIRRSKKPRTRT